MTEPNRIVQLLRYVADAIEAGDIDEDSVRQALFDGNGYTVADILLERDNEAPKSPRVTLALCCLPSGTV